MSARQPTAQSPPRHERPFRVLRYRDFRLIWSAEALSQTGTQIQRVAVAWQVFELTIEKSGGEGAKRIDESGSMSI